jgi:hypothetical protein
MAWTAADRDALQAHIAARLSGAQARRVRFGDREVELDSIEDCYKFLQLIEADLAATSDPPRPKQFLGYSAKGF